MSLESLTSVLVFPFNVSEFIFRSHLFGGAEAVNDFTWRIMKPWHNSSWLGWSVWGDLMGLLMEGLGSECALWLAAAGGGGDDLMGKECAPVGKASRVSVTGICGWCHFWEIPHRNVGCCQIQNCQWIIEGHKHRCTILTIDWIVFPIGKVAVYYAMDMC